MKRVLFVAALLLLAGLVPAQTSDNAENSYQNAAEKMLAADGKLTIGGYGQIDYNQPLSSEKRYNGVLDVHRLVMLFGYRFNERTQFITEVEYEHVSEVYIEQAFLQYKITPGLHFRGGLLLIPMGIVNEYHEPTTFNGVERPLIDNIISPTTWREIGFGISGNLIASSLKYQAYLVNGFSGYNGTAQFDGKNGLRKGRQKGANSYLSAPNFSGKVEYYGIKGLNVGVSGYFGNTQSTLYNGLSKDSDAALAKADSSVVGLSMVGVDARYTLEGVQLRGQYYFAGLSNTSPYNHFTAKNGKPNDLGSAMAGYYAEAAYNVFRPLNLKDELTPFVRLEGYNTHHAVADGLTKNKAYQTTAITTGLGWKPAPGAVLKADLQFVKPQTADKFTTTFNAGIGILF